jgi:hypothetical protein
VADAFHNVMFIVIVGNPTCAMVVCRELDMQNIVIQIELDSYTEFFLIVASYKINKLTLSFRD